MFTTLLRGMLRLIWVGAFSFGAAVLLLAAATPTPAVTPARLTVAATDAAARARTPPGQSYAVPAGFTLPEVTRDTYTVVEPPTPTPVPAPAASQSASTPAQSDGSGSEVSAGGAPPTPASSSGYSTDPADARAYAATLVSGSQFDCLVTLWNRESSWDVHAENADSGAYGIPQSLPGSKMAAVGDDWADNFKTQILWGLSYITAAYGTPCAALAHSDATGWY